MAAPGWFLEHVCCDPLIVEEQSEPSVDCRLKLQVQIFHKTWLKGKEFKCRYQKIDTFYLTVNERERKK